MHEFGKWVDETIAKGIEKLKEEILEEGDKVVLAGRFKTVPNDSEKKVIGCVVTI